MRDVTAPGRAWPLLATAALVAVAPVLAACDTGGDGEGSPLPYVAEFALGAETADAGQFVLTPTPDPGRWLSFEPSVTWVDDGQYLGVVTFGSSSCPAGPHGIEVVADQELAIRLGPLFPDRDVCSADVAGHVTVMELPRGITPTEPLTVRFDGSPVTLPPVGS